LIEIVLFIVDSGCSKHMTRNLKLLINFVEKFLGTVKFRNDQIASIFGYGDLVQGAITIKRVYYVEGLNHNLLSVGQFCDADLEVAFRKSTCFIRDLKGNDLLTGSRGTDLYSITLQDTNSPNPICLMAKASSSQAWLWHRRLSNLNFDTINLLSKNDIVVGLPKGLQAQVRVVRTDKGTEFLNQILHAYFAAEGIQHQMSVARTPEQNGVVKRRNRTLVEAARTMLSAAKVPLFFWPEAIATACFTQNRSLIIPRHEKTPYHIINDRKPSVKFFNIFGSVCYIVRDGENIDKIKEKGDEYIFVGYSNQSRAYRVFNKRTRVIMESIHVNFDELPQMASVHISSDPAPECQTMVLEQVSLSPRHKCQENVSHGDKTVTKLNELDLLFSPMFDELLNGPSQVFSKSSAVTTADECNQRQHLTTPLNNHTTPAPTYDEFINIFSTPVQDQEETSSRHVDSSNMHTFYQRYPSEHHWTQDHPLEQVIGNPSHSVRTR
nr:integrase, catalytic region, zinc finger, CCHC-type, peptidase aspartic, catalytic [Tanacetum cinerariifolium]